jgi:hypothetical protein
MIICLENKFLLNSQLNINKMGKKFFELEVEKRIVRNY